MKIFDRFKKKKETQKAQKETEDTEKKAPKEKPKTPIQQVQDRQKAQKVTEDIEKKPKEKAKKIKYQQAHRVLMRPIVSEKASTLGMYNQYVFEVSPRMNKIEVKKAIESIYGVKPIKVNILSVSGKNVRYGRSQGRTKDWKKAVITLKQGDTIQVYEGT